MPKEKPELMIVNDDKEWLDLLVDIMSKRGYDVVTADGSYQAIDQMAIRLHEGTSPPDIYLCDMLDRDHVIAKIEVKEWQESKLKNIHPAIALNFCNYLASKSIKPEYFVAHSLCLSRGDMAIAKELGIPLINTNGNELYNFFPDITGLTREDALKKYAENYSQMLKRYKRE